MTYALRAGGVLAALLLVGGCARPRCAAPCPTALQRAPVDATPAAAPQPETEGRSVLIETGIYRVPAANAQALLGAERGGTIRWMGLLSPADAATLADRLSKHPAVVRVAVPAIVSRSGDDATIFIGDSYREDLHRAAGLEPYDAALGDAYWSGDVIGVRATVRPSADALALDLFFIHREPPPKDATPDPAALLAGQLHGRMGIATMASEATAAMVVAPGAAAAPGERLVLLATPRVLPPEALATPRVLPPAAASAPAK